MLLCTCVSYMQQELKPPYAWQAIKWNYNFLYWISSFTLHPCLRQFSPLRPPLLLLYSNKTNSSAGEIPGHVKILTYTTQQKQPFLPSSIHAKPALPYLHAYANFIRAYKRQNQSNIHRQVTLDETGETRERERQRDRIPRIITHSPISLV